MLTDLGTSGRHLFTAMFSDDPVPDVEAAIVVAHPGDESVSASWLLVRLQERASVFCLTKVAHGCPGGLAPHGLGTIQAARLAGVPQDRCHNLGLSEQELGRDLETLVWLTTAAITTLQPSVLVTHACEGENLDHDATAFAVHMTAKLLTRCGGSPLIVEFPRRQDTTPTRSDAAVLNAHQAVRVEFGPESRKVKRRMLQCHGEGHAIDTDGLQSESYFLAKSGNPLDSLEDSQSTYIDAPWCRVADFQKQARAVAATLSRAVLSSPSRA